MSLGVIGVSLECLWSVFGVSLECLWVSLGKSYICRSALRATWALLIFNDL